MKSNQQNNHKSEDIIALINQEYLLVLDGKSADHLIKLLSNYEVDPLVGKIQNTQGLVQKYVHSLLVNGQYLDLSFLLSRYEQVAQGQLKHYQVLKKIADFGKRQEIKFMWENIHKYVKQLSDKKIGERIIEASIANTLATLSRYYLNFKVEDWVKLTNTTEKEVEFQAEVKDKYIQLKQKRNNDNCLQTKLKELVYVASKMNQFE